MRAVSAKCWNWRIHVYVKGLEMDLPISLMLVEIIAEMFYSRFTKLLGLPILLGVEGSCTIALKPQHGADSVDEPGKKLHFRYQ